MAAITSYDGTCHKCGQTGLHDDEAKKQHLLLSPDCAEYFGVKVRTKTITVAVQRPDPSEEEQLVSLVRMRKGKPKETTTFFVKYLMKKYKLHTFRDNEDILYYDAEHGIYRIGGEALLKAEIQAVVEKADAMDEYSTHFVSEAINHIRRLTYIGREEFEMPARFVCLNNGVFDLDAWLLKPHSPDFRFLGKLRVDYQPDAKCPEIEAFMREVLLPEDVPLMEEVAGYCLYRDYPMQTAFMLNGEGSNGKSTLLRIIEAMLGPDNVACVSLQRLAEDKFAVANLYGKHANIYSDLSDKALLDTGVFKMLCGGDTITAEKKFQDGFSFRNHAKLIYSANRLPRTVDGTDAFYRRWVIVDFTKQFTGSAEKKGLAAKLTTAQELSGFLNICLPALKRLLQNGCFTNDKTIDEKRRIYQQKSNTVQYFANEMLAPDADGEIEKDAIFPIYNTFCKERKLMALSHDVFFQVMLKLEGFEIYERKKGSKDRVRVLRGVKWKSEQENEAGEADDLQPGQNYLEV